MRVADELCGTRDHGLFHHSDSDVRFAASDKTAVGGDVYRPKRALADLALAPEGRNPVL